MLQDVLYSNPQEHSKVIYHDISLSLCDATLLSFWDYRLGDLFPVANELFPMEMVLLVHFGSSDHLLADGPHQGTKNGQKHLGPLFAARNQLLPSPGMEYVRGPNLVDDWMLGYKEARKCRPKSTSVNIHLEHVGGWDFFNFFSPSTFFGIETSPMYSWFSKKIQKKIQNSLLGLNPPAHLGNDLRKP